MTPVKFIAKLELYYAKNYESKYEKELYLKMLERFTSEDLDKILPKVYIECRWLPKISQIFSIAKDLMIDTIERSTASLNPDCAACRGTGWEVVVSYEVSSGKAYDSVKPCACAGPSSLRSNGTGNGWITEYNGTIVNENIGVEDSYEKQDFEDSSEASESSTRIPF